MGNSGGDVGQREEGKDNMQFLQVTGRLLLWVQWDSLEGFKQKSHMT